MQTTTNAKLVADRIFAADRMLTAFSSGEMQMHPSRYNELSAWVKESLRAMDSGFLRKLRKVAPFEIREIIENVLHEQRVVSWATDELVAFTSLAECISHLRHCRTRAQPTS